mmetsp:Transcript_19626/g.32272  ORF Transcript_19626/g.32272 Transcript_19626/m.32272 type:complete len:224 (+) Transcript_19626:132-803(+)
MGVVAIMGMWDHGAIIAIPFCVILLFAFSIGRSRMLKLLGTALSVAESSEAETAKQSQKTDPSGNTGTIGRTKTSADRTRRTILAIQRCSFHVILGIFLVILTGALYFLFNNSLLHSAGWKEYTQPGKIGVAPILNELMCFSIIYLLVTISHYSHRNISKLVKRKRGILSSSFEGDTRGQGSSFIMTNFKGSSVAMGETSEVVISVDERPGPPKTAAPLPPPM